MLDRFIVHFDKALRTVFAPATTTREMPGRNLDEASLSPAEKAHAGALMRINHVGEVCAQALYQGQALLSHDRAVCQALESAAYEETEHLAWTERRIRELGARKSLLNPLWYLGAFSMGLVAARSGNAWNLGFLAETERQVGAHLDNHLTLLPEQDMKSRAIVTQMRVDEIAHAETAESLGAADLPMPVKKLMKAVSGVMTRTAYYL